MRHLPRCLSGGWPACGGLLCACAAAAAAAGSPASTAGPEGLAMVLNASAASRSDAKPPSSAEAPAEVESISTPGESVALSPRPCCAAKLALPGRCGVEWGVLGNAGERLGVCMGGLEDCCCCCCLLPAALWPL